MPLSATIKQIKVALISIRLAFPLLPFPEIDEEFEIPQNRPIKALSQMHIESQVGTNFRESKLIKYASEQLFQMHLFWFQSFTAVYLLGIVLKLMRFNAGTFGMLTNAPLFSNCLRDIFMWKYSPGLKVTLERFEFTMV